MEQTDKDVWQTEANRQQEQRNELMISRLQTAAEFKAAKIPKSDPEARHAFINGYTDRPWLRRFCKKFSCHRLQYNQRMLEDSPEIPRATAGVADYSAALTNKSVDLVTDQADIDVSNDCIFRSAPRLPFLGEGDEADAIDHTTCHQEFGTCRRTAYVDTAKKCSVLSIA